MDEHKKSFGYRVGYYVVGPFLLLVGMAALGALAFIIGAGIR